LAIGWGERPERQQVQSMESKGEKGEPGVVQGAKEEKATDQSSERGKVGKKRWKRSLPDRNGKRMNHIVKTKTDCERSPNRGERKPGGRPGGKENRQKVSGIVGTKQNSGIRKIALRTRKRKNKDHARYGSREQ